MARYINQLQDTLADVSAQRDSLKEMVQDLEAYLQSDKFRCGDELDGYVNINDVLARLRNW
jgi:hypothetical protein